MASESVLDIESLCAPISEEQPCGPSWRDNDELRETLYPKVETAHRDARGNARALQELETKIALLQQQSRGRADSTQQMDDTKSREIAKLQKTKIDNPNWLAVVSAGSEFLKKSKDLWVAVWVAESLAKEYGFAGLRDGLKLLRMLCEKFWDGIHPRPDEAEGIRHTLAQMDGDLWKPLIMSIPITRNGNTTSDYDMSVEMEQLDREEDRSAYRLMGVIEVSRFEANIADSGQEFLKNLVDDVKAAKEEFDLLNEYLYEKCGHDAPPTTEADESFEQCHTLLVELCAPHLPAEALEDLDESEAGETSETTAEGDGAVAGSASGSAGKQSGWSRDAAFQEINRLADLFQRHEPNSPVANVLRQAVRLGGLSWQDLIRELATEEESRKIYRQTGVRPEENEND